MRLLLALLLWPSLAWAEARIVGGPGPGCIAGAVELPADGPGYMTIRVSRSTYWGHPDTITQLQLLAVRAQAAGLPTLYMNDIAQRYGGPTAGVHASHMTGLDADVWLDTAPKSRMSPAERDAIEVVSVVAADQRGVDLSRWNAGHATLIRLAATLPATDRVLVNAAIKRQLCLSVTGDRSWLRQVRPWYGHAAHLHIHFRCPANQPECVDQAPPPPGDGCDASLQWWFDRLDQPAVAETIPPSPPRLPAACASILRGRG